MAKQPPDDKTDRPAQVEILDKSTQNAGAIPQNAGASLQVEIHMLRTAMQRVFELDQGQPDPELTLKVLRALSTACGKLAGLLKSQQQFAGSEENEATAAITKALHDLMDEWGLK